MKLRVYLDTSVFSALEDLRAPDRKAPTRAFWDRMSEFVPGASLLTRRELEQTPDENHRRTLVDLLGSVREFPITDEMTNVAQQYVRCAVFSGAMFNDALHVAASVVERYDLLVSWNFKHLVNRRRRAEVNRVNLDLGLPRIEIVAPPEV